MANADDFDQVQQISGISYSVPIKLIRFADDPSANFINPRHVFLDGRPDPKGLMPNQLQSLKKSIREKGIQHPPILRGGKNVGSAALILLSGERRIRCIRQLIKEDAECFEPYTRKMIPAAQLYSRIVCNLHIDIDEQEAYHLAFTVNDTAEGIGEVAPVALVKRWRDSGWTNEQIIQTTDKSDTWLRDTDALINLDEKSFNALVEGKINRTVAISLTKIPNIGARQVHLAGILTLAAQRHTELTVNLNKTLEEALVEQELAEADAVDAEEMGNETAKKIAIAKVQKISSKIQKTKAEKLEAQDKVPVATKKDIDNLKSRNGISGKQLTYPKLDRHWIPAIEALVKSGGKDENGKVICPVEYAELFLHLYNNGMKKNYMNPVELFETFHAKKDK